MVIIFVFFNLDFYSQPDIKLWGFDLVLIIGPVGSQGLRLSCPMR